MILTILIPFWEFKSRCFPRGEKNIQMRFTTKIAPPCERQQTKVAQYDKNQIQTCF